MKIRVMADYSCDPLWDEGPSGPGNLAPSDLAISKDLVERFNRWAKSFDGTLCVDDPWSSGFASSEAEEAFEREGLYLARRLQVELGTSAQITYFSNMLGREVDPNDLRSAARPEGSDASDAEK